jgi:hypothetical protein
MPPLTGAELHRAPPVPTSLLLWRDNFFMPPSAVQRGQSPSGGDS